MQQKWLQNKKIEEGKRMKDKLTAEEIKYINYISSLKGKKSVYIIFVVSIGDLIYRIYIHDSYELKIDAIFVGVLITIYYHSKKIGIILKKLMDNSGK